MLIKKYCRKIIIFFIPILLLCGCAKTKAHMTSKPSIKEIPAEFIDGKFWVFKDKNSDKNHFVPSGWTGDTENIQLSDRSLDLYEKDNTCIKIVYNPHYKPEKRWSAVYWQFAAKSYRMPAYNLEKARKLKFRVRGEKGGEVIKECSVGYADKNYYNTVFARIGPISLTKEWKEHTIDLKNQDLSCIFQAFGWVIEEKGNPEGAVFYLDDIRYEQ